MGRHILPGDYVEVCWQLDSQILNPITEKYNGQVFQVARKKEIRSHNGTWGSYFELKGAESEYGIPYCFTKDDLIVLREVEQ